MKDSLFEMLLSLFEKTLTELKERQVPAPTDAEEPQALQDELAMETPEEAVQAEWIQSASTQAMRVFTGDERIKLTKASYQFLVRMLTWKVIHPDVMETIINQLIFSEARIVTLEETKWTIRSVLAETLDKNQLTFLDLVLYQKEEAYTLH